MVRKYKSKAPRLDERTISEAIANATNKVYIPALEKATPKRTGQTAKSWRVMIEKNEVQLVNLRFGDIVKFVDEGTLGPYEIRPVNANALRFEANNGDIIFAKKVTHPGIEARNFVRKVLNDKSLKSKFNKEVRNELKNIFIK